MDTEKNIVYVARPPWEGVGVAADEGLSGPEVREKAGMTFRVQEKNLFYANETTGVTERVENSKLLVRSDTGKQLAIMGEGYNVIQWDDAFSVIDEVVGAGKARYVAAGTMNGGRVGYMLARLPGELRVLDTDDIVEKYLLFATSFDGSLGNHFDLTPLRMWCQNMLVMAIKRARVRFTIRHTASAQEKLQEAGKLMSAALTDYDKFGRLANHLARVKFSEDQMKRLAAELFPKTGEGKNVRGGPTHGTMAREKLVDLFENGKGQHLVRGTAWAAWNAVTEFTDHYRMTRVAGEHDEGARREARLSSVWFGKSMRMKVKALEHINQYAVNARAA